jgi:hypothetical protein
MSDEVRREIETMVSEGFMSTDEAAQIAAQIEEGTV